MTTRAGWTGIIAGLIITIILFPLYIAWCNPDSVGRTEIFSLIVIILIILMIGCGFLAGRKSKSVQLWRCAVLGGLAGCLAGSIVFCLWGAAAAGMPFLPLSHSAEGGSFQIKQVDLISKAIRQTLGLFLVLFLGGGFLGGVGGWLSRFRGQAQEDVFDKADPQMAMNASISATAASVVAAVLSAGIFSHLDDVLGGQAGGIEQAAIQLPLQVSLLLVLLSQLALTLNVPHETKQAEHRNGMNEVKMAAFVGIVTAPVLVVVIYLIDPKFFKDPLIAAAILVISVLSLKSFHSLFKVVLPRRNSFALPPDNSKKTEYSLFGSIANSIAWRLVVLCAGCGIVMVLPIYVSVVSVLINLTGTMGRVTTTQPVPVFIWKPFLNHALASIGAMAVIIFLFSVMYIFYLNLGRRFSARNITKAD
jgi:hypothetical protein